MVDLEDGIIQSKGLQEGVQAMGRWRILYFLILCLSTLCFAHVHAQDQEFHIVYHQGFLSMSVKNADLQGVLAIVAEKTGILINSPENLKKSITIEFDRVPLEEGLHRMLRDISHVLIFSRSDEKNGVEIVSGVFIPSEEIKDLKTMRITPSKPIRSKPKEKNEENLENEEVVAGVTEHGENEQEDALLERYERQLDRLEERMEMIEEDSPEGKAIMSQILHLSKQIEKRLQELDREESP